MCLKCTAHCAACGIEFVTSHTRPSKFCSKACQHPPAYIRLLDGVIAEGECLVWTGHRDEKGYGYLWIDNEAVRIHRFILEWKIGRPLVDDECGLHRCDNPPCVKPSHLFVGTVADNNTDKMAKMRHTRGQEHPRSKLTQEQVIAISARLKAGERNMDLAREFGVSTGLIGHIKSGRNWRHITTP